MLHEKAKIIFMGTAEFAVPALKALAPATENGGAPWELTAIYTRPDREQGRGLEKQPSPVKRWLLQEQAAGRLTNVELCQPESLKSEEEQKLLRAARPDVIVVAAYGLLLPKAVLEIPGKGCVNLHPSLLPKYRGPAPIQNAILNNDTETGATIMLLDEKMDAGPLLAQEKLVLTDKLTADELHDQLAQMGARLLVKILPDYLAGRLESRPQDDSQATYTEKITKADGQIDWQKPALEIERQIRALNPWPGAYTFFAAGEEKPGAEAEKKQLTILAAEAAESAADAKTSGETNSRPGRIFIDPKTKRPAVKTGRGALILLRVKPAGKQEMDAQAFLNGQRGQLLSFSS